MKVAARILLLVEVMTHPVLGTQVAFKRMPIGQCVRKEGRVPRTWERHAVKQQGPVT
jgi:hypothetical protein